MKNSASSGVRVGVKASSATSARDQVGDVRRELLAGGPVATRPPSGRRSTAIVRVAAATDGERRGRRRAVRKQVAGVGRLARRSSMRAVEGDRPAAHDRDVVADLLDLVHVVRATAAPSARRPASRLTSARMSRMPPGSRPLAGSSSTSRRGLAQQAGGDAEALAHPVGVAADLVVLAARSGRRRRAPRRCGRAAGRRRAGRGPRGSGDRSGRGRIRALDEARRRRRGCARRPRAQVRPKTRISPLSGRIRPKSIRRRVVLPAPLGPRMP